jgi:hypothetical protein
MNEEIQPSEIETVSYNGRWHCWIVKGADGRRYSLPRRFFIFDFSTFKMVFFRLFLFWWVVAMALTGLVFSLLLRFYHHG